MCTPDCVVLCVYIYVYLAPGRRPSQKERMVFQPSIFRGELLVSGSMFF